MFLPRTWEKTFDTVDALGGAIVVRQAVEVRCGEAGDLSHAAKARWADYSCGTERDQTAVNKIRSPASSAPSENRTGALHQRLRRAFCVTMTLGIVTLGAGCSLMAPKPPPLPPPPPKPLPAPPPPKLSISVVAAAHLNPNIHGRASPVVVRLYELKSAAPFDTADFMSLYEKDRSVLGSELVAREEFMLEPGESKSINKLLGPEVRGLGVVVAYREIDRAQWRGMVNLVPGKDNAVVINLEDVVVRADVGQR